MDKGNRSHGAHQYEPGFGGMGRDEPVVGCLDPWLGGPADGAEHHGSGNPDDGPDQGTSTEGDGVEGCAGDYEAFHVYPVLVADPQDRSKRFLPEDASGRREITARCA